MSEEEFYYGAIDFWEENKELDSLHLLNKFIEEKYLPKLDIIKEVRELANTLDDNEDYIGQFIRQDILDVLDEVDKE